MMLATQLRELSNLEGFEILVVNPDTGKAVNTRMIGFPSFHRTFEKPAKSSLTVADWMNSRFHQVYPALHVDVLYADGQIAHVEQTLEQVRKTYEAE